MAERPRRARGTVDLQEQIRTARGEIRDQVRQTRAHFDEANARVTARTGRNLVFAVGFGLVFGVLVILSLVVVKQLFVGVSMLLVGFGTSEIAVALRHAGVRVPKVGSAVVGVLAVPVAYASMLPTTGTVDRPWVPGGWLAAIAGAVVAALAWRAVQQIRHPIGRPQLAKDLLHTAFVQLYVTGLGSAAVVLAAQTGGQWWTLAFLAVVVATDTFAYFSGLAFGRHAMVPRISPKKTWEGFAGAAVAAVVLGAILAPALLHEPVWFGAVFGAVILLAGTVGDLGESMIKRDLGIKDMSSWLPGHGGFLDRIDSVLPAASAALLLFLASG